MVDSSSSHWSAKPPSYNEIGKSTINQNYNPGCMFSMTVDYMYDTQVVTANMESPLRSEITIRNMGSILIRLNRWINIQLDFRRKYNDVTKMSNGNSIPSQIRNKF